MKYLLSYDYKGIRTDQLIKNMTELYGWIYRLIDSGNIKLDSKLSVWDYDLGHPVIFFNTN